MHSICLDSEGKVYAWGSNKYHEVTPKIEGYVDRLLVPTLIQFEKPCIKVGAGLHFCWAIDTDHYLWMWGDNLGGQLAQSEKGSRHSFFFDLYIKNDDNNDSILNLKRT